MSKDTTNMGSEDGGEEREQTKNKDPVLHTCNPCMQACMAHTRISLASRSTATNHPQLARSLASVSSSMRGPRSTTSLKAARLEW
jgi:hypothetical protein